MFNSLWEDVRRGFQQGNMVTRLIIVNSSVWVLMGLLKIIAGAGGGATMFYLDVLQWLEMPSSFSVLLRHPWSPLTAIFLHVEFQHIFWNMLTFYWFGRIVGDLLGNHRILPLYILCGLAGDLISLLVAHLMYGAGADAYALGASAAVMGMVACAATIAPDYEFNLIFVGPVKLKYIALLLLFLDALAISDNFNSGGHFAHLGGAAMGWLYAVNLRAGKDLGAPVAWVVNSIGSLWNQLFVNVPPPLRKIYQQEPSATGRKPRYRSENRRPGAEQPQNRVDSILEKIKLSGYASLTQEEKDILFNESKNK